MRTQTFLKSILYQFVFLLAFQLSAQQNDGLELIGMMKGVKVNNNEVQLRWAPLNYYTFSTGNELGYRLDRIMTHKNGEWLDSLNQVPTYVDLALSISPKSKANFEKIEADEDHKGVAMASIYSPDFTLEDMENSESIKAYHLNTERQNRFNFGLMMADQDIVIADAMGLAYTDNVQLNQQDGLTFMYLLFINLPGNEKQLIAQTSVSYNSTELTPEISNIELSSDEKSVQLAWTIEKANNPYVSYDIERKEKGVGSFTKINDKPVVFVDTDDEPIINGVYSDIAPSLGKWYYYRVVGKTSFGTKVTSAESIVRTRRKAIPAAVITDITELNESQFKINFEFPTNSNTKMRYVKFFRSDTRNGKYELLLQHKNFTHRNQVLTFEKSANYIKVVLQDKQHGDISSIARLVQLKDTTPPHQPEIEECICNKEGKVSLKWAHNSDLDLQGYRVWFSNQKDGTYSEITSAPAIDSFYTDYIEVKTLSELIYYKISALDYHQNESSFSLPCIVERPDIIPPTAPFLIRADGLPGSIELEWKWSQSSDVERHELQKKGAEQWTWQTVENFHAPIQLSEIWQDTNVVYQHSYSYRLLAYDEKDNVSSSKILKASPFDDGIRGDITRFTVQSERGGLFATNQRDQFVRLQWNYLENEDLEDFLLFRQINNGPMVAYKTLNKEANLEFDEAYTYYWNDADLGLIFVPKNSLTETPQGESGERKLTYQLMARHHDGGNSSLSEKAVLLTTFTVALGN